MNNKLRTLMAFSALSLSLAALPAFGGEIEPLRVSVPFAFTAGKTTLPAGDYTLSEDESHVLTIRGVKGSVLLLASPSAQAEEEKSAISFHHSEKGYELRVIRSSGREASLLFGSIANAEK